MINGGAGFALLALVFDARDVVLNTGSDGTADGSTEFGRAFALGIFFGVHFGGFDANEAEILAMRSLRSSGNSEVVPGLNASPSSSTSLAVNAPWS